jgi:hypothetical protein
MMVSRFLGVVPVTQPGFGIGGMVLAIRPSLTAERLLAELGAVMVAGYLTERLVRRRLLPSDWDAAESSVAAAGMSLAAVMALAGLRSAGPQAKADVAGMRGS